VSTTLGLKEIYQPIAAPLEGVRATVGQLWTDALQLVKVEVGENPLVGGKLLRPALCLMSAGAIGARDLHRYVRLAAAFETLHVASLAHDDVIDKAILRRGTASLNAMWDNHAAVLGGDYLVARAVEMLAEYDSCAVVANAIASVRQMAEGELLFFGRDEDSITEADCLQLARQKTASFFAEACCAPSFILDPTTRAALHAYGLSLGTSFQIVDDLLDLTQPPDKLGKPACGDVVEGKITLPILYMREGLDGPGRARLRSLRGAELTDDDRQWLMQMLEETGARERTEALNRQFTREALEQLQTLPASDYRESMETLLEFLQVRSS